MNLFDDSTVPNLESSLETMTPAHDTHTGGSAVVDAPEHAQPSPAETLATTPDAREKDAPKTESRENASPANVRGVDISDAHAPANRDSVNEDHDDSTHDSASAGSDDFAAALHNFENQTEEAVSDDHVIKGTVVKLTSTHVVVDIGAKSEGMAPIAEILDHEGNPRFKPGDEIDVMREKGETEEGYVNLSHLKGTAPAFMG